MVNRVSSQKVSAFCVIICVFFTSFLLGANSSEPLEHAQILFLRNDYQAVLALLGEDIKDQDGRFLAAESLFRLKRYKEAQNIFKKMLDSEQDTAKRKKIYMRIFECNLFGGDINELLASYNDYKKKFQITPPFMSYALAKTLYDAKKENEAKEFFKLVGPNNPWTMRALYMISAIELSSRSNKELIKSFFQIEGMTPLCVEDFSVRQMAILAQARLYSDENQYDQAKKAYERVLLESSFGKEATAEFIRLMLFRAEHAELGTGEFKNASKDVRSMAREKSLIEAEHAFMRFSRVEEIGYKDPELFILMGRVLLKRGRLSDARMVFNELINHYRPIEKSLRKGSALIWPSLMLDAHKESTAPNAPLIAGIRDQYLMPLPGLNELLSFKSKILENEQKLQLLIYENQLSKIKNKYLEKAKVNQQALKKAYEEYALEKQKEFQKIIADRINKLLAEPEFLRAEIPLIFLRTQRKKENIIRDFQTESIQQFEQRIKKIDQGESP